MVPIHDLLSALQVGSFAILHCGASCTTRPGETRGLDSSIRLGFGSFERSEHLAPEDTWRYAPAIKLRVLSRQKGRDALLTRSKGHFRPEGGSTRRPAAHPSLDRTSRVFRRISSFLLPPSHFSSHLTSPHTPADRMGKQTRRPRVASRAVGRRVVASTGLKLHSAPAVQHHLHKRRHTAPPIGRRPLETGTVASTSPQPQPPPSANPFRVPTTVLFSR